MRLTSFLVLATAALLACVDIVSADKATKTITRNTMPATYSYTDYASEFSASKRMLRTYDEDGEERVGPGKLVDLVKSSTSKFADSSKLNKYLLFNKNGVKVLNKLKLGDDVGSALKSSKMNSLAAYIDMFNKKHPNNKISMIGTLTARYGDDAVADALVAAQRYQNTEALAKQLRKDQLAAWLKKDTSVYDVFAMLKLGNDNYYALASRKLEVLEDYISLFNREKHFSEKTLLSTLTVGFGGETKMAGILAVAKENPFSREKALELESALFNKWLVSKKQPDAVFKNLRLDVNLRDTLNDFNLQTLTDYVSFFKKKNPGSEVSLIGTLTAHYGDDVVAKVLAETAEFPITGRTAKQLQKAQFAQWLDEGYDSISVLTKIFKVEEANLAGASRSQKSIAKQFKAYYEREMRVPNVVEPRRS